MTVLASLVELAARRFDSEAEAIALVRQVANWFLVAAGLNLLFGLVLAEHQATGIGLAYVALTLWLRRGYAALAATLLAVLSLLSLIDRLLMTIESPLWHVVPFLVAAYVAVLSVRAVEACVRLPKLAQRAGLRMTEDGGVAAQRAGKVKVYGKPKG